MQDSEQLLVIEALLFANPEPLKQNQVNLIFESDAPKLKTVIPRLQSKYEEEGHAFEIQEVAGGYQLVSRQEYEVWIRRLIHKSGRLMLSNAALESLSIIAYRQPISRYEIESIRGVDCSGVLKTLLSRQLIKIRGRDSGPGRPLLYGTTDNFLEYFGLSNLSDMPKLREIRELDAKDVPEERLPSAAEQPAGDSPEE